MLFIEATAVVSSIISWTCFPESEAWKHLRANRTAKSSRQLMWLLASVTDHLLPVEISFITAPHSAREASEYSITSTCGWRIGLRLPTKLHNHHYISETPFSEITMCATKFPLEHLRALIHFQVPVIECAIFDSFGRLDTKWPISRAMSRILTEWEPSTEKIRKSLTYVCYLQWAWQSFLQNQ